MLNDRQAKLVVQKTNEDFNVPLVSEAGEEKWLDDIVDQVVPMLEPSLQTMLPAIYVDCIKISLDESIPITERREQISKLMRDQLAGPLTEQLNDRVDIARVPEMFEGKVLKVVSEKVIDVVVQSTAGDV